ncbi:MAG: Ribosomal RNA small subunit methyltransferase G [Flavobacteriales bacterium]|nr:MAG: Ribosomal RNA small subunit methyltransferase G [Flavobacteriales bacterium]|tara:strand:+ start:705 stop:1325 length:621 start_codon:yes stop_codon:yes gene_type:complete
MITSIINQFPTINAVQKKQFESLMPLYQDWNQRINVISRTDIEHFYTRHVLHSLGIAKAQPFIADSKILDVGTGGGFPGIPLAILFPEVQFTLVDSIGKKIKVVKAVASSLGLKNINAFHKRAESVEGSYDFVVSRAVTHMERFVPWVEKKISTNNKHECDNGILYLKGGDLEEELKSFPKAETTPLSQFFSDDFFDTKKVVYLPI